MPRKVILKKYINNYQIISWGGQSIFSRYTQLKNFLRNNLGDEFVSLFAEPYITV